MLRMIWSIRIQLSLLPSPARSSPSRPPQVRRRSPERRHPEPGALLPSETSTLPAASSSATPRPSCPQARRHPWPRSRSACAISHRAQAGCSVSWQRAHALPSAHTPQHCLGGSVQAVPALAGGPLVNWSNWSNVEHREDVIRRSMSSLDQAPGEVPPPLQRRRLCRRVSDEQAVLPLSHAVEVSRDEVRADMTRFMSSLSGLCDTCVERRDRR